MIWPDHPEFVRMAARFGATIVPFGAVGEDDIVEVGFFFFYQMTYTFEDTNFSAFSFGKKKYISSPLTFHQTWF